MAKARTCNLCGERPATVPDRDQWPAKRHDQICGECHAARLGGDMLRVAEAEARKGDGR